MAGPKKTPRLKIALSRDELETLARAAARDGADGTKIDAWARRVLLDHARAQLGTEGDASPPTTQPAAPVAKPTVHDTGLKCECGHTHHPNGNCDGSCLGFRW